MRYLLVVALLAVGCVEANDPGPASTADHAGEVSARPDAGSADVDRAPDAADWPTCQTPFGVSVGPCGPAYSTSPGSFAACFVPSGSGQATQIVGCILTAFDGYAGVRCAVVCPY